MVAAGLSVFMTYVILTDAPPLLKTPKNLNFFLNLDLVLLLLLAGVVIHKLLGLWQEHRRGQAGSRLHVRMVATFSLLTIVPTVFVAIFAALFFYMGVQGWFNARVETAINESTSVARAYLGEHQKVISSNAQAMALDLASHVSLTHEPERLSTFLTESVGMRSLSEAIVFDKTMDIIARSRFAYSMDFEAIKADDLQKSQESVVIYTNDHSNRVRALVHVRDGVYLLVGRYVSPEILARIEDVEKAAQEYKSISAHASRMAIKFALLFMGVGFMLLLMAIWGGVHFANKLAFPISQLMDASNQVRQGNLDVKIPQSQEGQELSSLVESFNRMTEQLNAQRKELTKANSKLDRRRRFTEAVLSGVSAGVIGLDKKGRINLPNHSASQLLEFDLTTCVGEDFDKVIPQMASLFHKVKGESGASSEGEVVMDAKSHGRTLFVRIAADQFEGGVHGYVVTFDDITELQSAQRHAAWSDVARRIAHEIKNPLTPIQLSAERLRRRFLPQIDDGKEIFGTCIDTIIRQVGHIGAMVSEFASFARMPEASMEVTELVSVLKEAIFLEQEAFPQIRFEFVRDVETLYMHCDSNQMTQSLTNLLKNAAEAIVEKGDEALEGHIKVTLNEEPNRIILTIDDNGVGLPQTGRERLAEPYVTHRDKGTGLGLAIVRRIVEDHQGVMSFADGPLGGARIKLTFSRFEDPRHNRAGNAKKYDA